MIRARFIAAHQTRSARLAMIDEMEGYFTDCPDGARGRLCALQIRAIHEDERVWRPAIEEIASYGTEVSDA